MRLTTMLVTAAMAGVAGTASPVALEQTSRRSLTVYMLDGEAPGIVAAEARSRAAKMFAGLGIEIQWRRGEPRSARPDNIVIRMSGRTPRDYCRGALAYALPYEGVHITVFFDRVQQAVAPYLVPILLAHVLVHEITHVLQAVNGHSQEGVMKARWDDGDYARMAQQPLSFTEADVLLIQNGLASRASKLAAAGLTAANHLPAAADRD
jgi:hypothetical protein